MPDNDKLTTEQAFDAFLEWLINGPAIARRWYDEAHTLRQERDEARAEATRLQEREADGWLEAAAQTRIHELAVEVVDLRLQLTVSRSRAAAWESLYKSTKE